MQQPWSLKPRNIIIKEAVTFLLAGLLFLTLTEKIPEMQILLIFFFIFFSSSSIFLLLGVLVASRCPNFFSRAQWWDYHVIEATFLPVSILAAAISLIELIKLFGPSTSWSLILTLTFLGWLLLLILAVTSMSQWKGRTTWAQRLEVLAVLCGVLVVILNAFNSMSSVSAISETQSKLALGIGLISIGVASLLRNRGVNP